MTMLAVFRSRSHAAAFSARLGGAGIKNALAPAPKEAGIGCGLCVKFDARDFNKVRTNLAIYGYRSFAGFYGYGYRGGKLAVVPVRLR